MTVATAQPIDSEKLLRAILDNAPENIVLIDKNYKVLCLNATMKQTLLEHFSKVPNVGDDYREYVKSPNKEIFIEAFDKALNGESTEVELQTVDVQKWFCFKVNPVYDTNKNFLGVAFSAIDIHKRKLLEQERQKITDDLIARNRDLEQFAYIVSHNLRAPIANIIGLGEILKTSNHDETRKLMLSSLDISISRLDEVVRDLNDLLQIKRELNETRVAIDLNELVESIKASLSQTIQSTNTIVETDFSAAPELLSIRSYLYSIFFNLISNSIKYGSPSRNPRLKIFSKKSGNRISIHFSDNGSGLDLDKYGKELFGLYKRFHPEKEGKGIGLFMTKHQIEALGAKIDVTSTPNKGTEFTVTFNV